MTLNDLLVGILIDFLLFVMIVGFLVLFYWLERRKIYPDAKDTKEWLWGRKGWFRD